MHANQFSIPMRWDDASKRIVVDEAAFLRMRQQSGQELATFTNCRTDKDKCKAVQGAQPPKVGDVTATTESKKAGS